MSIKTQAGRAAPLAVGSLLLFAGHAAQAQDETGALAPIDIEATLPTEVDQTPGAATQITEEQIETYQPYTLMDTLDFAPGVRTIYDDVLGRRSGIAIRGAPARRSRKVLLMEDGVPINASTYIDPSAHYTPPQERLERVDVLKGAGHVLHGPLNNHGIINFINKRPTETPETTVELAGGDPSTFKRHIMHTRTDGPLGLVLSYSGLDADGSFDIEDFSYDDFFASGDLAINETQDLGLSITYFRERSDYDESNLLPAEFAANPRSKTGRFAQENNNFSINYWKFDLTHDWQLTDSLSMSTKLFHTDLERPRFTVEPDEVDINDGVPDFSPAGYEDPAFFFEPGVSGVMIGRDRSYQTTGVESRFQLSGIQAGGLTHNFQWGVRYEVHEFENREPVGDTGELLNEGNRGRTGIGVTEPTTGEENSLAEFDADAVSGFFQDAIRIGFWTVTPGIRVERYTQEREVIIDDSGPGSPREKDDNTLVLPSLSVVYDGYERTQWFANVGRGYTPAFARTADDFPLEPETGINSQVGFRTSAFQGLRMEGAVFYNKYKDTITQEPITIDGTSLVVNNDDSRSYGFDVGGRFDSAALTGSRLNLFAELAYSFTKAEFTSGPVDGNDIPEVPDHAGNLTLGMEHEAGWHLSATVHHFGDFFSGSLNSDVITVADEDGEPVDPANPTRPNGLLEIREPIIFGEVPSHTIYSARASYQLPNTGTTLWLQGRNLTDKLFPVDYANGLRPGPERTVVIGLTSKFE